MKTKLTKRLRILCGEIPVCDIFADVGCDHGYCTQYALEHGLCRKAYISDISAKSLQKAETLLAPHIAEGRVESICCAGLEKIPREAEAVMIAGMGGEEIISILKNGFLPQKLLLQPMQNVPKVRAFLLENGYAILRDFTFRDGKYYDVLFAERGGVGRKYDARSIEFGYDNLHSPSEDFHLKVEEDITKCRARLERAGKPVPAVEERLRVLAEIRDEIARGV